MAEYTVPMSLQSESGRLVGFAFPALTVDVVKINVPFSDPYMFYSGNGIISSTVKEFNLPFNIPLKRKVLLLDERDEQIIRKTWSNETTGAYSFSGLKHGVKYTVMSFDHTGTYRAVIADGQYPVATT